MTKLPIQYMKGSVLSMKSLVVVRCLHPTTTARHLHKARYLTEQEMLTGLLFDF